MGAAGMVARESIIPNAVRKFSRGRATTARHRRPAAAEARDDRTLSRKTTRGATPVPGPLREYSRSAAARRGIEVFD
jgi:hypothetical protein